MTIGDVELMGAQMIHQIQVVFDGFVTSCLLTFPNARSGAMYVWPGGAYLRLMLSNLNSGDVLSVRLGGEDRATLLCFSID